MSHQQYNQGWNDAIKCVQKYLIDHANYQETYPEDLDTLLKKTTKAEVAALFKNANLD
jgi:pyrroloquinoline quinone (PQQ) biosynthesis protein C